MDTQTQWITGWSVAGDDRVVGTVHNRPGCAGPRTIVTSSVVQVRFMGESKTPVAFTESGNAYWLRDPSDRFGLDAAEQFVWRLSRTPRPDAEPSEERMRTVVMPSRRVLPSLAEHFREGAMATGFLVIDS